jgi:8-oxo-dGTP pyrophosphatase MutT (NUDIX family)
MRRKLRRLLLTAAYRVYGLRWRLLRPVTIGVRVILASGGRVLLVKHTYQDAWIFPGGGVEYGESLTEAARREAREEAGAVMAADPVLVGIYTNVEEGKSDHIALFACDSFFLQQPTDTWEIEARRFFDIDDLPAEIPLRIRQRLAEWRTGRRGLTVEW